ncbi:hypothetical protein RQ734_20935 [Roseomonas mucosa]|uniref:hypothetical protein n=1 Tax=Roseomonas mucosa TaxID=207340 RepID=UPI0028CFB2E0|nr:hypothetical protein [Roseomonas mucosa]MDT8278526.1 hypothetical protein [Roseomonas mucosa]
MGLHDDMPSRGDPDRQAPFVPDDMPAITNADLVNGIAAGGYIRGVMVEAQEPDSRKPSYALYILTSWRKGYSVFHIAWPARPRLFKDLDRVIEMLRFEFNYRGVVSVRLAGEQVAQKSARLRTRPDDQSSDPVES